MNIPAKFQGKGFFFLQQPISDMNCPCQEYRRLKTFAYGTDRYTVDCRATVQHFLILKRKLFLKSDCVKTKRNFIFRFKGIF